MSRIETFCKELPADIRMHGGHPEGRKISLRAGNLTMYLQNGSLRYISDGQTELIRMIYSAVRDKDWLTAEPVLSGETVSKTQDSFTAGFDIRYQLGAVDFAAHYTITGYPDNTVVFEMDGEALTTFEKSRIGFCLLHPASVCAGIDCTIVHDDQAEEQLIFPTDIDPGQPFMDIRSMKWRAGDSSCEVEFEGDIFETEDQRNWTDASFKTYCTPQALPCPVRIEKGDKIVQRITLRAECRTPAPRLKDEPVTISFDQDGRLPFPMTGTQQPSFSRAVSAEELRLLEKIRFSHYRTDIHLFSNDWQERAELALADSEKLKLPLEIALFMSDAAKAEAAEFSKWISGKKAAVVLIHLFHNMEQATPGWFREELSGILFRAVPGATISYGTNANYAELNRLRPSGSKPAYLVFSVHPQEHASDNETLVENLLGQGAAVLSAMNISQGSRICVSPANIIRRFNANVESYEAPSADHTFPPQADSRLMSLFGACWTAGSFKVLAEAGADMITFFEAAGERGILQGDDASRWPGEFRSVPGMLFPVYHLLSWLTQAGPGAFIHRSSSTSPLKAEGVFISSGEKLRVVLVNYTPYRQKINLPAMTEGAELKRLDASSFEKACFDPGWLADNWQKIAPGINFIQAEPYSVNFLEIKQGNL